MRCGLLLTLVAVAILDGPRLQAQVTLKSTFKNEINGTATVDPPKVTGELADWKLETIELRDGRSFGGLILRDTGEYLELDEVHRQAGKPLYLIKRRFPLALVKMLTRLGEDERKILSDQLQKYRNRNQEESERMNEVKLLRSKAAGREAWNYQSPWFDLESRMDEELTRRAVVRIEQMFLGFRGDFAFVDLAPQRPLENRALRHQ